MCRPTGPVILAANHRAVLDTAVISLVVRRRVQFLGKTEYFTAGGVRGRLMAAAMDFSGWTERNLRARRAATDQVMAAIQELSRQEYVNAYHQRPDENIA
jgi:1-acyl-sn-glycerol-3-phosphate acyltransferase